MSCETERRKRQSYGWAKKMALLSLPLVMDNIVIYREKGFENVYGYCCETDFNNIRGEVIETLYNKK